MSDDLKVHAIVVGVNSDNEDMLLQWLLLKCRTRDRCFIIEEAFRCPDFCPPKSPLN